MSKRTDLQKSNEVTTLTNLIVNEALMMSARHEKKSAPRTHMAIKTMATKITLIKVMLLVNYEG